MTRGTRKGKLSEEVKHSSANAPIISWGELLMRAWSGNMRNREENLEMMCTKREDAGHKPPLRGRCL